MNKKYLALVIPISVLVLFAVLVPTNPQYYDSQIQKSNTEVLSDSEGGNQLPSIEGRPVYNEQLIRDGLHNEINGYRVQNNLTVLEYDPVIQGVAQGHATDQVARNYFSHYSPEGISSVQRGINAGFDYCGDVVMNEKQKQYDKDLGEYQVKRNEYNQRVIALNEKTNQFNKLNSANSGFIDRPNQAGINTQLNKLSSEIDQEAARLEGPRKDILSKEAELQNTRLELNAAIDSDMLHNGLAENESKQDLWESIQGSMVTWNTEEQLIANTMDGWKNSPEHNEQLLYPYDSRHGIGVALDYTNNKLIVVDNFC